jgi:hypothetical protein
MISWGGGGGGFCPPPACMLKKALDIEHAYIVVYLKRFHLRGIISWLRTT